MISNYEYPFAEAGRPQLDVARLQETGEFSRHFGCEITLENGFVSVERLMERLDIKVDLEGVIVREAGKLLRHSAVEERIMEALCETGEIPADLLEQQDRLLQRAEELTIDQVPAVAEEFEGEDPGTAGLIRNLVNLRDTIGDGQQPLAYNFDTISGLVEGNVYRVVDTLAHELKDQILKALEEIPANELDEVAPVMNNQHWIPRCRGAKRSFEGTPVVLVNKLYEALGTNSKFVFHNVYAHDSIRVSNEALLEAERQRMEVSGE